MVRRDELEAEIACEELRLADLRVEVEAASARLAALREQLAAEPLVRIAAPPEPAPARASAPFRIPPRSPCSDRSSAVVKTSSLVAGKT